jgi:competence protein ComEC
MSRRWPFLIPFLFMTTGMTLAAFSGFYADSITVAAVFLCLLLSCFLPNRALFSACAALFFFLWGASVLRPWLSPDIPPHAISRKTSVTPLTIEGIISSRPSVAPEGSRIVVTVEAVLSGVQRETVTGDMLLYVAEGDVSLHRGDRIRFISRVSVPKRLGLPGEFDYQRYLALQGISATGRVASQNEIVLIRGAAVPSWLRDIDRSAYRLGTAIRSAVPDERISSILTALLIGDQRRIPRDLTDAYTRAGVNHILSISGFHVGIIAAFITVSLIWLLTRFEYLALRWNVRIIAVVMAVPVMGAYLLLTGTAPATARSVLMLSVFAGALCVERERDAINTLLLAAFILVALNPPTLFDVSFQLSFLSLWGILIAVPFITKRSGSIASLWLRSFIQFIVASVAASCATLIPVLYIFKVASFNGILTNFLIVPLLGYGAVLSGFIALPLVTLFPASAPVLLWPAATLVALSNAFILWCSALPIVTFHGITGWDMFFFLLFMTCMTFVRSGSVKRISLAVIAITAIVLHIYSAHGTDGRLHITMLSVGQAESMLVRLPDGSTLLIDGGGYLHDTGHDFGQRVLAPALGALHISRIDTMISTHDHPDHSGGLPYIIQNFAVGEFLSSSKVSENSVRALRGKKVPQRTVAAGDVITLPGAVVLTVLSPERSNNPAQVENEVSVNEQSLVFRLSYGSFSMLFCADAGFAAEQKLLVGKHDLQSTVLKVGHHGSRYSTSEEFLERVDPEAAFISAGAGNRFGLPAARTVELLRENGVVLYRTDRVGTIELVTNGSDWSVVTNLKSNDH